MSLLLTACGGGGGGGGGGGSNTPSPSPETLQSVLAQPLGQEVACSLTLSATRAVPGETITLTGMPANFDAPGLRVIAQTVDGPLIAPLFIHADAWEKGNVAFTAPLHPSGAAEGGDVELELGDGERHCPRLAFTIEPLPSAPAHYALTLQDDLELWVDKSLLKMGYNSATLLRADPDTLPEARLGLWLAKQFVSGDGPDALPALAARAAADGDETLERILKASKLEDELNDALIELAGVPNGTREGSAVTSAASRSARSQGGAEPAGQARFTSAVSRSSTGCQAQAFDPEKLSITSASDLSERMLAAADGYVFDGSTSGRVLGAASLTDVAGQGTATGHIGTGVFVVSTVAAARRALEPQEITSFEVQVAETRWTEDRDPADHLIWGSARVEAQGTSFNLGEATLNSLINVVGMVPGPVGTAVGAATTAAPGAIDNAVKDLTAESCFHVAAPEYGPINVSDEQWTEDEITQGDTVELVSHGKYRGIDIGVSELTVRLKADRFASLPFSKEFWIDVQPIRISLFPSFSRVTPGDNVIIEATATNIHEDTANPADFEAEPSGEGGIFDKGPVDELYQVHFDSPEDRTAYPTGVRFRWQGRTLPAGAVRTAVAEVDTGGKIEILRRSACLTPGSTLPLNAELEGFAPGNRGVTWTSSRGSITGATALTATLQVPGGNGAIDITVTADADPSVTDTVHYTVSDTCMKKIWLQGAVLSLDGGGDYYSGGNTYCPEDNHDDTQRAVLEPGPAAVTEPPDLPPGWALWYDRTESINRNFTHSSNRHIDVGATCQTVALTGHNNSSVTYSGSADDTLSFSMDVDLASTCRAFPSGEVDCVGGSASASTAGSYYFTIGSEAQYRVTGELSCGDFAGNIGMTVPISGVILRYSGGTEPLPGLLRKPNGDLRSPQLFSVSCTQADQVIPIDVPFVLDAPAAGAEDLIVLQLTGKIMAASAGIPVPSPGTTPSLPAPEAGNYQVTADIDFSLKLERE